MGKNDDVGNLDMPQRSHKLDICIGKNSIYKDTILFLISNRVLGTYEGELSYLNNQNFQCELCLQINFFLKASHL